MDVEKCAIALASDTCAGCQGGGYRSTRDVHTGRGSLSGEKAKAAKAPSAPAEVCYCVWRKVFRICYERFRILAGDNESLEHVSQALSGNWLAPDRDCPEFQQVSYPSIHFACDFLLIARRALPCPRDWQIFSMTFLAAADYRFCCRRLKLERGDFFHLKYQIEERLGHAFAHTLPYPLYPLDEYFLTETKGIPFGSRHTCTQAPMVQPLYTITRRVQPPLFKMAA